MNGEAGNFDRGNMNTDSNIGGGVDTGYRAEDIPGHGRVYHPGKDEVLMVETVNLETEAVHVDHPSRGGETYQSKELVPLKEINFNTLLEVAGLLEMKGAEDPEDLLKSLALIVESPEKLEEVASLMEDIKDRLPEAGDLSKVLQGLKNCLR